jgi:Putative DNA-binding domain
VRLPELQDLLARAIAEPEGVERRTLEAAIDARAPLDAVARAEIYAGMYRFRLADALGADFPRLARLIGDEGFFELACAYARAHPSESSDIGRFGRHLAEFLVEHPGPRGDEADLAQLDWARTEALTAPDVEPVGQEALGRLGAEAIPSARLRFVPSLAVLTLGNDVTPVWRALEEEKEPPEAAARAAQVAVWRKGFDVFHASMTDAEAEALARARGGGTLAEVCEVFAAEAEDAQGVAFRTLGAWFSDGWVAGVEAP